MIIIAGTLVIYRQFRYMTNMELGFHKTNMVVLDRLDPLDKQIQVFKDELTSHASILSATNSTCYLGATNNNSTFPIKGRPVEEGTNLWVYYTDEDFMKTYGIELATPDSRFLSEEFPGDSSACLINETTVRKYQLEDPLNTVLIQPSQDETQSEIRVIGVVKDHHFSSLKNEIENQIIMLKPKSWDWAGYLTVSIAPGRENVEAALDHIQTKWEEFTQDEPLQYFFLDEELDKYYAEEKRTGAITLIFSILAIFIASLGLFGLTLYNSQKRIREIGIRKVLGANEASIITVISKSVGYAVVIAIAIAMPVAYFMMRDWLRDFPYNVGFQPLLFLLAALLAVVIAMVTVTITSLKAARTNPAVALHYE
jgi:putative ABC transport system permease protein